MGDGPDMHHVLEARRGDIAPGPGEGVRIDLTGEPRPAECLGTENRINARGACPDVDASHR